MSIDRPLSTLEMTALGIILKQGPCIAHTIVTEFAGSQTYAYRSGAGSVYPLLKRLTDAGLLTCEDRRYSLTAQGTQALREWIMPPFEPNEITTNLDALRSRAYFLKVLYRDEVVEFCRKSYQALEQLLEECKETCEAYGVSGDRISQLAMRGAILETEARMEWIKELERSYSSDIL